MYTCSWTGIIYNKHVSTHTSNIGSITIVPGLKQSEKHAKYVKHFILRDYNMP